MTDVTVPCQRGRQRQSLRAAVMVTTAGHRVQVVAGQAPFAQPSTGVKNGIGTEEAKIVEGLHYRHSFVIQCVINRR